MNRDNKGLIEIIAGIFIFLAGVLGVLFGRNIKQFSIRLVVLILSSIAIFSGVSIFALGIHDYAVGKFGDYKLGEAYMQPMVYESKEALTKGIKATFSNQKELHRLTFQCPDKSNGFTIYKTPIVLWGIPSKGITCDNGFELLSFKK